MLVVKTYFLLIKPISLHVHPFTATYQHTHSFFLIRIWLTWRPLYTTCLLPRPHQTPNQYQPLILHVTMMSLPHPTSTLIFTRIPKQVSKRNSSNHLQSIRLHVLYYNVSQNLPYGCTYVYPDVHITTFIITNHPLPHHIHYYKPSFTSTTTLISLNTLLYKSLRPHIHYSLFHHPILTVPNLPTLSSAIHLTTPRNYIPYLHISANMYGTFKMLCATVHIGTHLKIHGP